ncbi:MAG: DNA-binding transcriptional MerR regulator [Verrucomicrobiales bacterium]|jgi:DNA-binding transcriptional MerR regulator
MAKDPPTDTSEDESDFVSGYDISVVARKTGLTPANLRVWERRYQAISPKRSKSGRRQYSEEDVTRLRLLKDLAQLGHPVRATASLQIEELAKLRAEQEDDPPADLRVVLLDTTACRVVCIGALLQSVGNDLPDTSTVATFADMEAAESAIEAPQTDLLLIEFPALFDDSITRIQRLVERCAALRAIVFYTFAQKRALESLSQAGDRLAAIRGPLSAEQLQLACSTAVADAIRTSRQEVPAVVLPKVDDRIPERQFSDQEIAELAQISSTIECECPQHIANLLANLTAFEDYSANCENRHADDAEMHAYLHQMTAHARSVIEDAMCFLIEFENIELN